MVVRAIAVSLSALLLAGCANLSWPSFLTQERAPAAAAHVSVEPDSYARGKALFADGNYGRALVVFRKAQRDNADDPRVQNALAAAYDKLGRFDLADRHYQASLALDPTRPATLNNWAYSHMLRGDVARARHLLAAADTTEANPVVRANARLASRLEATAGQSETAPAEQRAQRPVARARDESAARPSPVAHLNRTPSLVRLGANQWQLRTKPVRLDPRQPRGSVEPMKLAAGDMIPVQVVNATGRRGMAGRLTRYFADRRVDVVTPANGRRWDVRASRIECRPAACERARALARELPVTVAVVPDERAGERIRLIAGADMLRFDRTLIAAAGAARGTDG